jgi:hypothetical protein
VGQKCQRPASVLPIQGKYCHFEAPYNSILLPCLKQPGFFIPRLQHEAAIIAGVISTAPTIVLTVLYLKDPQNISIR